MYRNTKIVLRLKDRVAGHAGALGRRWARRARPESASGRAWGAQVGAGQARGA